jgi:hypothetical protein
MAVAHRRGKEAAMTLSDVMLNHPVETVLWTGILALLLEGLMVGFIRCCREKDQD